MYVNLEVSNMNEMGCTDDLKFDGSTDVTAQQHRKHGAMMGRAVLERLHCRLCGLEAEYYTFFLGWPGSALMSSGDWRRRTLNLIRSRKQAPAFAAIESCQNLLSAFVCHGDFWVDRSRSGLVRHCCPLSHFPAARWFWRARG
jgi:hypothetical protein